MSRQFGFVLALASLFLVGCFSPTGTSNDFYNRGVEAFPKDKNKAEKMFKEALKQNPNNEYAHNQLGRIYFGRRDLDKAVEQFQAAARLQPNNLIFLENLGVAAYLKRDFDTAGKVFVRASELSPESPSYPYYLGRIAEEEGHRDAAIQYYQRALKADEFYTQARVRLYHLEARPLTSTPSSQK